MALSATLEQDFLSSNLKSQSHLWFQRTVTLYFPISVQGSERRLLLSALMSKHLSHERINPLRRCCEQGICSSLSWIFLPAWALRSDPLKEDAIEAVFAVWIGNCLTIRKLAAMEQTKSPAVPEFLSVIAANSMWWVKSKRIDKYMWYTPRVLPSFCRVVAVQKHPQSGFVGLVSSLSFLFCEFSVSPWTRVNFYPQQPLTRSPVSQLLLLTSSSCAFLAPWSFM